MSMEPITKEDAASLGLQHYFTGKPCKRGHLSKRYVSNGCCRECKKEDAKTPEARAYAKAFWASEQGAISRKFANRPEVRIPRQNRYRESGKSREWEQKHAASGRKRETVNAWCKRNRHKTAEWWARYNAAKVKATPPWLTSEHKSKMHEIYSKAKELGMSVDHIVPIRGKTVCGLHVPWNLQLLTQAENSQKSNKWGDAEG